MVESEFDEFKSMDPKARMEVAKKREATDMKSWRSGMRQRRRRRRIRGRGLLHKLGRSRRGPRRRLPRGMER